MKPLTDQRLDQLLRDLAARRPPSAQTSLRQDVWREIGSRVRPREGWFVGFAELFERPVLAFAACALTVLIGFAAGWARPDSRASNKLTQQALHLDVFAPAAPDRPASRIAFHP